ncbi:Phosphatidylinositol N-acetylglucosaminyltransferase subunit C [Exaiptasia diaphana]|nr:Phosphatidylinositol N-acetylglucosaminyltransferase subunit C [Exaiptasia diaphana]
MTERKPWRKVLYEVQDYPDNYVDHSFLEKLKKNLYTRTYDFRRVAWESCMVSQQISCVCLFVAIFVYMDNKVLLPSTLITISSILTILGYVEVSWIHVPLTLMLLVVVTCLLYPISVLFAVLLVLVHVTVTIVCPLWFVQLQSLKNNIHGPWDEAIIQD